MSSLAPGSSWSDSDFQTMRVVSAAIVALLSFVACSTPPSDSSQTTHSQQRGTVFWRGFHHQWTYNHRLNRLGDYATLECQNTPRAELPRRTCEGEIVHTAASGTGADTATFRSFYTEVVSRNVGFQTGRVELRIDGREERDLRVEHDGTIPAEGLLQGRDNYVVLLNGFDVYANGRRAKAKKVQRFRIWSRSEGEYIASDETVEFELGALLNLNCDSVECKQQSNRVRYTVELQFVIVAYDDSVRKTTKPFEISYAWDKKRELQKSAVPLSQKKSQIRGVKRDFESAVVGFREIDVTLGKKGRPKDHWFVTWMQAVRNIEYEQSTGLAQFDLDLFFKEWNRRAKKKLTSIARKGNATLRADLALLQFESASIEHHDASGRIEWRGRNRSATSDAAVWRHPFDMAF